jgi:hypothetical protein
LFYGNAWRFEKAFPEILPVLPFPKGGELFGDSMNDSTASPFGKGEAVKKSPSPYPLPRGERVNI